MHGKWFPNLYLFSVIGVFLLSESIFATEEPVFRIVQNQHYRLKVKADKGASLVEIYNKDTSTSYLVEGCSSNIFAVEVDGKQLRPDSFLLQDLTDAKTDDSSVFEIAFKNVKENITAKLSLTVASDNQIVLGLSIVNLRENARDIRVQFPLMDHLKVGQYLKDAVYLFPREQGWVSSKPYELAVVYGNMPGSMQVISLFNPVDGSGFYYWTKDPTGRMKTLMLRKQLEANNTLISWDCCGEEMKVNKTYFNNDPGITLVTQSYPYKVKPGNTITLPSVVVGIGRFGWRETLDSYSAWVRTWWHAPSPTVPLKYRSCYSYVCGHDRDGGPGLETGFIDFKNNRYVLDEKIDPNLQQKVQLAYWGLHDYTDHEGIKKDEKWYRNTIGDYYCDKEFGGVSALAKTIKKTQQKGVPVVLYVSCPTLLWYYSVNAENFFYARRMDKDGNYPKDWWFDAPGGNLRYMDMCSQVEAWQDFLATEAARVAAETGCDGVYLDTANNVWFCYNPAHKHPEYPAIAAEKYLKKIRAAVKAVNPKCVVESENPCSDYLLQWTDACWSKTFGGGGEDYSEFDAYGLYFLRFYFPEIVWSEWGTTFEQGARRCFFNGVGYDLHLPSSDFLHRPKSVKDANTDTEMVWLKRAMQVFRENGDAFASLTPVPMVASLARNVHINKFPIEGKVVYTFFNKSGRDFDGDVIKFINPGRDKHVVELFREEELVLNAGDSNSVLKLSLKKGDATAVAVLPKRIDIHIAGGYLSISLKDFDLKLDKLFLKAGICPNVQIDLSDQLLKKIKNNYVGKKLVFKITRDGFMRDMLILN